VQLAIPTTNNCGSGGSRERRSFAASAAPTTNAAYSEYRELEMHHGVKRRTKKGEQRPPFLLNHSTQID
jgi:hypothetical protein